MVDVFSKQFGRRSKFRYCHHPLRRDTTVLMHEDIHGKISPAQKDEKIHPPSHPLSPAIPLGKPKRSNSPKERFCCMLLLFIRDTRMSKSSGSIKLSSTGRSATWRVFENWLLGTGTTKVWLDCFNARYHMDICNVLSV